MPTRSDVGSIRFQQVSKRFQLQEGQTLREFVPAFFRGAGWTPPFHALREISFCLAPGETLGIVGRNGSGKSTILKLTAGVTAPSEGEVRVHGRVSPLIELSAGFHPDLTGRENVFLNASILGISTREARARFQEIVDFAELWEFMDTPVKRYSTGMYMRLGFAVAVQTDPDILLVDEILAVGDTAFQQKCVAKMREFQARGVTIMLVTHNLELAETFCQRMIWLQEGRVTAEGVPAQVTQAYRAAMGL